MDTPQPTKQPETERQRQYLVALSLVPGATLGKVDRLVKTFGVFPLLDATRCVIDDPAIQPSDISFLTKVAALDAERLLEQAHEQLALSEQHEARIFTHLDHDYPLNLREATSAPAVLYVRGRLQAERDRRSVAIVGTREASELGRRRATQLARFLIEHDWVIVSGLARGIDTAAHTGSLAAHGRTVAVVGCGLDRTYPRENEALARKIIEQGAVISQFPFGTPPASYNFPQRNKTMALLSLATVVIEAGEQSGAKMQADFALSTATPKRQVFFTKSLVDGQGEGGWARQFLRRGAEVIERAEDVLALIQGSAIRQAALPM